MIGTLMMATFVGTIAANAVSEIEKNVINERNIQVSIQPIYDSDGDGHIGIYDTIVYYYHRFTNMIYSKYVYRKIMVVFIASIWLCIGVLYGVFYEKYDLDHAFYFAIGAMAASGNPSPTCTPVDIMTFPSTTSDSPIQYSMLATPTWLQPGDGSSIDEDDTDTTCILYPFRLVHMPLKLIIYTLCIYVLAILYVYTCCIICISYNVYYATRAIYILIGRSF